MNRIYRMEFLLVVRYDAFVQIQSNNLLIPLIRSILSKNEG